MLSIIENNPYRILGVYSDSKLMDIIANANKIKAFAKVGRSIPFDTDSIHGFSTPPERSVESVESALAIIQSDSDRPKHSIFWFNQRGVDFGTSDLIEGNIKSAGLKFISAIESNDFSSIQEIIGDKVNSYSSSDLLNCYISVMKESGCLDDAVKGCLSGAKRESHIALLTTLKKGGVSEELKKKADSISEIAIDNLSSAFSSLRKIIDDVLHLIIDNDALGDLTITGAYDQVCKSVRSKVISISNKAYDDIGKLEKDEFKTLLESCLKILQSIDTISASAGISAKISEDIETMSNNIKDLDETYQIAIATNKNICWFCGQKATQTKKKSYEKKEEQYAGYNKTLVTTYTKTITFHICDECAKEEETASKWDKYGMIFVVLVELGVAIYFTGNNTWGWEFSWYSLWVVIIGNLLGGYFVTMWVGKGLGRIARRIFAGSGIRKYTRSESDHPFVKRIKREGFS